MDVSFLNSLAKLNSLTTSILVITHNWGGGTETYLQNLRLYLSKYSLVILRPHQQFLQLTLPGISPLYFSYDNNNLLIFLKQLNLSGLHINHLINFNLSWMLDFIELLGL